MQLSLSRSPLTEPQRFTLPAGLTIAQVLREINAPVEIYTHGVVWIGDHIIPQELWGRVKPKGNIRVGLKLQGGGSKGKGSIFGILAAIALLAVVTLVSGGLLAGTALASMTGFSFAAGSTSAMLAAAGIATVGSLALNALTAPPAVASDSSASTGPDLKSSSISGPNTLKPFDTIPRVLGKVRVTPPHLTMPWTETVYGAQYVNAVVGLAGPHSLEDIQVNGTSISEFTDSIEYETTPGHDTDSALTVVTKMVRQESRNEQLVKFDVSDTGDENDTNYGRIPLSDPGTPQWLYFKSRDQADEVWLEVLLTSLLGTEGDKYRAGLPFFIEAREVGDTTWRKFPELHLVGEKRGMFRTAIKFKFTDTDPNGTTRWTADTLTPWMEAFASTGTDSLGYNEEWVSDSYFGSTAGSTLQAYHFTMEDNNAVFYLLPASWPKGEYEFRIKIGWCYRRAPSGSAWGTESGTFDPATHKVYQVQVTSSDYFSGFVCFHKWCATAVIGEFIPQSQFKMSYGATLVSVASVWNEPPLSTDAGYAKIALRARDMAIDSISVLATSHAYTWDGSNWATFAATQNPAALARSILLGQNNKRPVAESQLDTSAFEAWSTFCDTYDLQCNYYTEKTLSISQVLAILAGCGRASYRRSDKISFVIENDRTGETPEQVFTPRNTNSISVRRAFPSTPHAFRITWLDEDNNFEPAETYVYRDGYSALNAELIESIEYLGITNSARVLERAELDFGQLKYRNALYSFNTDIEHLYATKGSLVALSTDIIQFHHSSARVVSVQTSGPNITGLTLDEKLRVSSMNDLGTIPDLGVVPDLGSVGSPGVLIQLKSGSTLVKEIVNSGDSEVITFTTPFAASDIEEGCLVACGPLASETKRMIVLGVAPAADLQAKVTLVDEAPELNTEF